MTDTMPIQIQPHQDAVSLEHALAKRIAGILSTSVAGMPAVYRNCCTCLHFIEHMEMCEVFSQRPPAKIIAYGCEKHSQHIPF